MTFPLDSGIKGSLCENIAVSLKPLPFEARPSSTTLFNQIFEFCELLQMSPGSAADIGAVYNLTQIDDLNSEAKKKITKRVYEQSLKVRNVIDQNSRTIPSFPPGNLRDSLNAGKRCLPSLSKLLKKICHLVDITGLELPSFTAIQPTVDQFYPCLERSEEDRVGWTIFLTFQNRRFFPKNELIVNFLKEADSAQVWRNRIDLVTSKINQCKSSRIEKITYRSLFRNGTWQFQANHLQLLLNSLICEEKIENQLNLFFKELNESIELDISELGVEESYERADRASFEQLKSHLAKVDIASCKFMTNIIGQFNGELEKTTMDLSFNDLPSHSARANRNYRGIKALKKLKMKYIEMPIPNFMKSNSSYWQFTINHFASRCDSLIQRIKVSRLLIEIVECCTELYENNELDEATADLCIPALNAINQQFVKSWKISLPASSPIKIKTSQMIENAKRAASLLQITRMNRHELYDELAGRLWNYQMKDKKHQRDFFQFTKLYSGFKNLEEILPKSLSSTTRKPQKAQLNHKERKGKSPISSEVEIETDDFNESSAPCSPIDEDLNIALMVRKKSAFKVGVWKSNFNYHERVKRWFTAELPLGQLHFPEYQEKNFGYQTLMLRLHRLIPLVDFFSQRGLEIAGISNRGEAIKRRILPAELETSDGVDRGVIIWAINENEVCYHRFFHIKLETDQIYNAVKRAFEESQVDQNDEVNVQNSTVLEFINGADDLVEIDDLIGQATLRNTNIPDLTVKLKFLKF